MSKLWMNIVVNPQAIRNKCAGIYNVKAKFTFCVLSHDISAYNLILYNKLGSVLSVL